MAQDNQKASSIEQALHSQQTVEIFSSYSWQLKAIYTIVALYINWVLFNSALTLWKIGGGSAILAFFPIGYILLFSVPIGFVLVYWCFKNSATLVLTDKHLEFRGWHCIRVDWKNIQSVNKKVSYYPFGFGCITQFVLETSVSDELIQYADFVERFIYRFTKDKPLIIGVSSLKVDQDALMEVISKQIEKSA